MKARHALLAAALMVSAGAHSQQTDHSARHTAQATSTAPEARSVGEVRRIDLAQGKITLRHGPLANLDMPAMTMVFTVADSRLLDGLKEGDKVAFTADKKDGTYIVTAIEAVK